MTVSPRTALARLTIAAALSSALAVAGCTTGKPGEHTGSTSSGASTTATPAAKAPPTASPEASPTAGPGLSPSGVTTSVNAQASSLEEEYYQACHTAAVWIAGKQGDRQQLVEQYLQYVQTPPHADAGTFHKTWTDLPPERQAAVIVAAHAAANQECG